MSIKFHCPQCGKAITAPDSGAGRKGKCSCGTILTVPAGSQFADPAPSDDVVDAEVLPAEPVMEEYSQEPAYPPAEAGAYDVVEPPYATAVDPSEQRRPCPMCGEMIPVSAVKCRFCSTIFDPALRAAQARSSNPQDDDMTAGEWVVAILCSGIGCIFGIIWLIQGKRKGGKMLGVSFVVWLLVVLIWTMIGVMMESARR